MADTRPLPISVYASLAFVLMPSCVELGRVAGRVDHRIDESPRGDGGDDVLLGFVRDLKKNIETAGKDVNEVVDPIWWTRLKLRKGGYNGLVAPCRNFLQ